MAVAREELFVLLESAYVWMHAGKESTAAVVLEELCALAPDWHFPWLARALLAQQREDYRQALVWLRTAQRLARRRDESVVRMHLAEVLLCLGKLEEGRKELRAARDAGHGDAAGRWAALRLERLQSAPRPSRPRLR